MVLVGVIDSDDLEQAAREAARRALAWLPESARKACQGLAVSWVKSRDEVFAAAFGVTAESAVGQFSGSSWMAPGDWPAPMPVVKVPGERALAQALDRVRATIASRDAQAQDRFNVELSQAFKLV